MRRRWRSLSLSSNDAIPGLVDLATVKLVVSYDGTDFAGSQIQPGQRTVQEELERALSRLLQRETRITLAGRADRGVHAAGKVASLVDSRADLENGTIVRAL